MFIIYDLVFFLISLVYLPVYFFRGKFHAGLLARLGVLPKDLAFNKPIWIHAVSVGEVMAVKGLLEELRARYPKKKFVLSTVTPTGNKIAKSLIKEGDLLTYLPLDFSFIVRSVIDRIDPALFILAETEIWPNLISYLYRKKVPVITVNGRLSDASFKGYSRIIFLIKPILEKVALFCMQTDRDKERLSDLGVPQDKIAVTGNMKFDMKYSQASDDDYWAKLGLGGQEKLFVCGSTHPGEEEIILAAYKELLKNISNLRLLIAPRHPERAEVVANLAKDFGFKAVKISQINDSTLQRLNASTLFILDTVGELIQYYAVADLVFVGGSLVKTGGHNILEPANFSKPIIIGPEMFNFRDIADLFLKSNAILLVRNRQELRQAALELLSDPAKAGKLGERSKELVVENQGASRRNAGLIIQYAANL